MTRPAEPAPGSARRHVHEIDVVRVLTFAAVIAVHVTANVNGQDRPANAVVMLLHFTREAFFVLTGFVLTHQYFGRTYQVRKFWARRFLTVGVPYVVWTVIYTGLKWHEGDLAGSGLNKLHTFGTYLLLGTAWYHLYFLIVSLQLYLLYPLISALLRATRGHHGALLVVSGALELVTMWFIRFDPATTGALGEVFRRADVLFVSYQFYVLLGAVAAIHHARLVTWIRRNAWLVPVGLVATGALAIGWYARELVDGLRPVTAVSVLQPAMVPWSAATIAALFTLGVWWSSHRTPGSVADRFFLLGSDRSFGVFLVHPLILWLILRHLDALGIAGLPRYWLTLVAYLLTVAGSVAAIELARRSPASLALTGRLRPAREPAAAGSTRKERHARHHARPAPARRQTALGRSHHDDRPRPADALVRGHGD